MNIAFIAQPADKNALPKSYQAIIDACKNLHHKVNYDYVIAPPSGKDLKKQYQTIIKSIKQSEVVIAEGTALNAEITRFISIALQHHIPTLVLYSKNNPEAFVFEASRLLTFKRYTSQTTELVVESYLKQANRKRLLYRFNLMMSKEMDLFVLDKAKKTKVSKADYIRQLITADMHKKS